MNKAKDIYIEEPEQETITQPKNQRRPDLTHPHYGVSPTQWSDILRRIDQGEPLRQIVKDYDVSY